MVFADDRNSGRGPRYLGQLIVSGSVPVNAAVLLAAVAGALPFSNPPLESLLAENLIKDRYNAFFGSDFMPLIRQDQTQGAPERVAYANEYAAHQLGEINKKLGRLIELMESAATNGIGR